MDQENVETERCASGDHEFGLVAEVINDLRDQCHSTSINAGWYPSREIEDLDVCQKLLLIHSEISEACEGYRKNERDAHLPERPSIEVELADAMTRILDLAGYLQLDLGGAYVEKMAYNAKRADHKPEARAAKNGKRF